MTATKAYAAQQADSPLAPFSIDRRELGPKDIRIEIMYCGVCHSDLHMARNEWKSTVYPVVPGHEILGRITEVGSEVTKFKAGDLAGVGCLVDSCRHCSSCKEGLEQFCENGSTGTYNGKLKDGKVTYGGYSANIVVDEAYTLHIPDALPADKAAPLLCAGITTYSPLRHWKVGKGHKLAVIGLGGLGHMAVKLAVSMGAEVTLLSTSPNKEQDAKRLGAHNFVVTADPAEVSKYNATFDFIIDTVSAPHDYTMYLNLLRRDGVMICVGAPPSPAQIAVFSLIGKRRSISGSPIGGIAETQEMLDYCAAHGIVPDVEMIRMDEINEAYERMLKGDVKYRFVIDMKTL